MQPSGAITVIGRVNPSQWGMPELITERSAV